MLKFKNLISFILLLMLILLSACLLIINLVSDDGNKIYCEESQRGVVACTQLYQPVCGYVQVECIKEPCDLQPQIFSNDCFACANDRVQYYTMGEC